MVKAIIDIDNEANRVINIVKAEHGLRDKSQAINVMAKEYERLVFEPRIRPEYVKRLKRIEKEGTVSEKEFERILKVKV